MKSNYLVLVVLFLVSCGKDSGRETVSAPVKDIIQPPTFSADSAYQFIADQVAFGPRVPNSDAHIVCGKYLEEKLKEYGAQVTLQSFEGQAYNGTSLALTNIIGSFFPEKNKRILLAAHWDTRHVADKDDDESRRKEPIDGANDGASGVGVLLELARNLQVQQPSVGIDIIFFDGEDYGEPQGEEIITQNNEIYWCLGSQYWSANPHKPGYRAYYGILLDMVGAKNSQFYQEPTSLQYAPTIVRKVWNTGRDLGYGGLFINSRSNGGVTDDHVFVNTVAKTPMIDIIDYDPASYFGSYHHTHKDNLSIIDRATLKGVGQTLLQVIYNE